MLLLSPYHVQRAYTAVQDNEACIQRGLPFAGALCVPHPPQTTSRERTQLFKTTRPVDRMYNLHAVEGLLLGEGCQHATSATQTKAVRPANEHGHQHLSRPWQVTARRTNFLATRAAPKDCVQKQHVLICVKASHKPCLKASRIFGGVRHSGDDNASLCELETA